MWNNPLDRHMFFRSLRKTLMKRFGKEEGSRIWEESERELERILRHDPALKKRNGFLVVPLVAVYATLETHGKDAERILNEYGDQQGILFARIVHGITSIPGVAGLLWKNMEKNMDRMSSEKLGYQRRIVSQPPEMFGVDILSCPYHELAKELGKEKAVLCICHMDKKYMQGFRHIRYERSNAVSEGAQYCDYRLRLDKEKK